MSSSISSKTRLCGENISCVLKNVNLRCASTAPSPNRSAAGFGHRLSHYWDTVPPTADQLRRAQKFFSVAPPKLLFSSTKFLTVKDSAVPEVAFLGRSNVGKSSLLNALMGQNICHTSSKPGRTRSMNVFAVGGDDGRGSPGKLAVLDMPGYGKGSREEWGPEIMKYLVGRKQLRRAFLLIDPKHGIKRSDGELLSFLRQNAVSHQIIMSKVDRILFGKHSPSKLRIEKNYSDLLCIFQEWRGKLQPGLEDGPEALGEILACSAEATIQGKKLGINDIRWAVLAATGLSDAERKLSPSEVWTGIPNDSIVTGNKVESDSILKRG